MVCGQLQTRHTAPAAQRRLQGAAFEQLLASVGRVWFRLGLQGFNQVLGENCGIAVIDEAHIWLTLTEFAHRRNVADQQLGSAGESFHEAPTGYEWMGQVDVTPATLQPVHVLREREMPQPLHLAGNPVALKKLLGPAAPTAEGLWRTPEVVRRILACDLHTDLRARLHQFRQGTDELRKPAQRLHAACSVGQQRIAMAL